MRLLFVCALFMALVSLSETSYSQDIKAGEKLFGANCQACHSIGKGKIVGPDLKDVTTRRDNEWLHKFIPEPMKMIKSGDAVAAKLFEEHNQIQMPDQTYLKKEDIDNILAYITEQSVAAAAPPKEEPKKEVVDEAKKNETAAKQDTALTPMEYFTYTMLAICVLLICVVIILLLQIFKSLKSTDQKE